MTPHFSGLGPHLTAQQNGTGVGFGMGTLDNMKPHFPHLKSGVAITICSRDTVRREVTGNSPSPMLSRYRLSLPFSAASSCLRSLRPPMLSLDTPALPLAQFGHALPASGPRLSLCKVGLSSTTLGHVTLQRGLGAPNPRENWVEVRQGACVWGEPLTSVLQMLLWLKHYPQIAHHIFPLEGMLFARSVGVSSEIQPWQRPSA